MRYYSKDNSENIIKNLNKKLSLKWLKLKEKMFKLNFKDVQTSFFKTRVRIMKKLIFSLLLFLIIPIVTLASDVDYDIESYYIDANILENGDVEVSEIFLVDGTLNGYEMNLAYSNIRSSMKADDITNIKVSGLNRKEISFSTFDENFTPFNLVTYASVGEDIK